MESERPTDDRAKEIVDAFDLEHPELGIMAETENFVAAFTIPEMPSPDDPGRPISLCHDCWDKSGRPEAEQETDEAVFQWVKEHDPALYKKLIHCGRCGVKFGFVKA
jgi:hypothetical protein